MRRCKEWQSFTRVSDMKTGKSGIFKRKNSSCYFVKQANISGIIIKPNAIPQQYGMAFFMLSYFQ